MIAPGQSVQLWVSFTQRWSSGFEIVEIVDGGYQVRRCSDGFLLPAPTSERDVRLDASDSRHVHGEAAPPSLRS